MNSKEKAVVILSIALATPISLFSYAETGLPISIAVSILGCFLVPKYRNHKVGIAYVSAISLSFLAFLYSSIAVAGEIKIAPVISVVFFFMPAGSFFLGAFVMDSKEKLSLFIKTYSYFFLGSFFLYVTSVLLFNNAVVRSEGTMNGSILGMPIYGAYGVHSFVAFLFVSFFIVQESYNKYDYINNIVYHSFILLFLYITIFSLSREAIIGLIILLFFYIKDWVTERKKNLPRIYRYVAPICLIILVYLRFEDIAYVWGTRLDQSLASSDVDDLSSGRFSLVYLAIEQFLKNPFFGTGFYGYSLYENQLSGFEDGLAGWSTHYYILTALWKMGSLPFSCYLLFWLFALSYQRTEKNSHIRSVYFNRMLLMSWIVLNQFWDALLVPNVMGVIMFVAGGYYGIYHQDKKIRKNGLTSKKTGFIIHNDS
jgi:O-Antigen ligase